MWITKGKRGREIGEESEDVVGNRYCSLEKGGKGKMELGKVEEIGNHYG